MRFPGRMSILGLLLIFLIFLIVFLDDLNTFFSLNRNRKLPHGSVSSGGMKVETKVHIF